MSELVDAYEAYWTQRDAYKKADRESLDNRLSPERDRLGRAISAEINAGKLSMTEVQEILGTNNRNFLYSALKGVPYLEYVNTPSLKPRKGTKLENALADIVEPEDRFTVHRETQIVDMTISGKRTRFEYELDAQGFMIVPEEWYAAERTPEELAFYRLIARQAAKPVDMPETQTLESFTGTED